MREDPTYEEGGPAFPFQFANPNTRKMDWVCGMSLRDWFAGKALVGRIAHICFISALDERREAELCYRMADAMLAERIRKAATPDADGEK